MKVCNICNEQKELNEFSKDRNQCKLCYKEKNKESRKKYYKNNKEKINKKTKEYRKNNKEKTKEYQKDYHKKNKEKLNKYRKIYQIQYYKDNKEKIKKYKNENKEKIKKYQKEYIKEYIKERRKTDPIFKLRYNLGIRTHQSFKSKYWHKDNTTAEMLGASYEVCKQHLERQFIKGMTWENHGEWHIDHIIPLASANTKQELYKLCHYTNLQPLWAEDNLSKSDTMPNVQVKLRI